MRMNRSAKVSAKDIINQYPEQELAKIFWEYGELKNSRRLARAIVNNRTDKEINTIKSFTDLLMPFIPKHAEYKFLAKIFQALRIEVNREMDFLKEMLLQTTEVIKPGGRLVVITYHSLEDRLVKNFIKTESLKAKLKRIFMEEQTCLLKQ